MGSRKWMGVAARLVLLAPLPAAASLGGNVDTISTDQLNMKVLRAQRVTAQAYSVHEMRTEEGTTVKEYASADGRVFAVTWSGPSQPDLRQLLGKYFDRYTGAVKTMRAGHRHAIVRQPDLVVQSSGHMRAFSGKAYVPGMIPEGVSVDELQ